MDRKPLFSGDHFPEITPCIPGKSITDVYSFRELIDMRRTLFTALCVLERMDRVAFMEAESGSEKFCFNLIADLHMLLQSIETAISNRSKK